MRQYKIAPFNFNLESLSKIKFLTTLLLIIGIFSVASSFIYLSTIEESGSSDTVEYIEWVTPNSYIKTDMQSGVDTGRIYRSFSETNGLEGLAIYTVDERFEIRRILPGTSNSEQITHTSSHVDKFIINGEGTKLVYRKFVDDNLQLSNDAPLESELGIPLHKLTSSINIIDLNTLEDWELFNISKLEFDSSAIEDYLFPEEQSLRMGDVWLIDFIDTDRFIYIQDYDIYLFDTRTNEKHLLARKEFKCNFGLKGHYYEQVLNIQAGCYEGSIDYLFKFSEGELKPFGSISPTYFHAVMGRMPTTGISGMAVYTENRYIDDHFEVWFEIYEGEVLKKKIEFTNLDGEDVRYGLGIDEDFPDWTVLYVTDDQIYKIYSLDKDLTLTELKTLDGGRISILKYFGLESKKFLWLNDSQKGIYTLLDLSSGDEYVIDNHNVFTELIQIELAPLEL